MITPIAAFSHDFRRRFTAFRAPRARRRAWQQGTIDADAFSPYYDAAIIDILIAAAIFDVTSHRTMLAADATRFVSSLMMICRHCRHFFATACLLLLPPVLMLFHAIPQCRVRNVRADARRFRQFHALYCSSQIVCSQRSISAIRHCPLPSPDIAARPSASRHRPSFFAACIGVRAFVYARMNMPMFEGVEMRDHDRMNI